MAICTFFGHSDCPESIRPLLRKTVETLMHDYSVTLFYVGNHGGFDRLVRSVLRELKGQNPQIDYAVVLAYLPKGKDPLDPTEDPDTLFPEGIEMVPPRFAISWRNKWMLKQADIVVTYLTHPWGGAAQFARLAEKQHKRLIHLGQAGNSQT